MSLDPPDPRPIAEAFDLGDPRGPMTPVTGGMSHHMWRVDTARGSFAIKVINRDWGNPDYAPWYERAFAFENAAYAAGIPMPRPVPVAATGGCLAEIVGAAEKTLTVRAHEWVDAEVMLGAPYGDDEAREIGRIHAMIHALGLRSDEEPSRQLPVFGADTWRELATRLAETDVSWRVDLLASLPAIEKIEAFIDEARAASAPLILSHRDAWQANVMKTPEGGLLLIDWDAAGPVNARMDIANHALTWARVHDGEPAPRLARAVIDGYRRAGGAYDHPRASDCGELIATMTGWLIFNVRRCLGERLLDPSDRAIALREGGAVVGNLRRYASSPAEWAALLA